MIKTPVALTRYFYELLFNFGTMLKIRGKSALCGVPTYNSYHTELKCLARENLLSKEIAILIPRSNLWRWKNEPVDKYKIFDLNVRETLDYELICSFSQSKNAKRIFSAYVRLGKFLVEMTHGIPKFRKHVYDKRVQIVKLIERVKSSIGLLNALRVFKISVLSNESELLSDKSH